MNKDNFKSYVALIGSMLIFGTLGVVRRYVPLSSAMLALCRGALGSVFLLIFVLVRGGKLKLPERKATLWLVLTGVIMGLLDAAILGLQLHHRCGGHHVLLHAADHRHSAVAARAS